MNMYNLKSGIFSGFRTFCIAILILLAFHHTVHGQWNVVGYRSVSNNKIRLATKLSVSDHSKILFPNGDSFCATQFLEKAGKLTANNYSMLEYFGWMRGVSEKLIFKGKDNIHLRSDQARVSMNIHTTNVKKFMVIFTDVERTWVAREFNITSEGYQLPIETYLLGWDVGKSELAFSDKDLMISDVTIIYEPKDIHKVAKISVGRFELGDYESHKRSRVLPWLDSLVGINPISGSEIFDEYSDWYLKRLGDPCSQVGLPSFEKFAIEQGLAGGLVEFRTNDSSSSERALLEGLLLKAIDLYPFYEQKKIDKNLIRGQFQQIFKTSYSSYQELLIKLREVTADKFKDGHFELILPRVSQRVRSQSDLRSQGPVRLKHFFDEVVIAAVFDEDYKKVIPYGSKVISIDGVAIDQSTDINRVLMRRSDDSAKISILVSKPEYKIQDVVIRYNRPIRIAENFTPRHGEFKQLPDSVVYMRINNWRGDSFYTIINNRKKILQSKGLIIDLRNNGGGFSDEVYRTLALFIDQVEHLGEIEFPWFKESISVFPANQEFRFPNNLRVALLVDEGTACASEIFSIGMKRRKNTVLVGNSRTRGAIANPTLYRFPSGVIVKAHTNNKRYRFDKLVYMEGEGIDPDIWVSRTHIRDTFPYEDKILKIASVVVRK